jgi:hypothetical protein
VSEAFADFKEFFNYRESSPSNNKYMSGKRSSNGQYSMRFADPLMIELRRALEQFNELLEKPPGKKNDNKLILEHLGKK